MTGSATASPVLLGCAVVAVSGAVASDLALGEHPTHSVVLGAVALVVAVLSRRLFCGVVAALPAVAGALAVQPVLHATADAARPADAPHLLLDGATAGVQIVVPALALVVAAIAVRLVVVAVRTRTRVPSVPVPPRAVRLPVLCLPSGPLLCRCGWALLAARRGPPGGFAAP